MAASSPLALLQHLIIKPSSSSSLTATLLVKPLSLSLTPHLLPTIFPYSLPNKSRLFCNSTTFPQTPPSLFLDEPQNHEQQPKSEDSQTPIKVASLSNSALKLPTLSVKEKKELTAYAHSLGKKLKVQQVGKWGVTDSVAAAFVENLESNELLKLKIQNNCQAELPEVIKLLEVKTGSVAIGQIGRTVILYRPSLTKLKAEEKKKEAQRVHSRRVFRARPTEFRVKPMEYRSKSDDEQVEKKRRPAPKLSSRGRRGTSRNELP
ncbi:hypothetical protein ACHQM5_024767 [Ranunculus cassubicifolius]